MKRVRTEQIQYAVSQYLKRRQYADTDGSLKGAKLFQSAEEMAASLTGEPTHRAELARLPTVRMYRPLRSHVSSCVWLSEQCRQSRAVPTSSRRHPASLTPSSMRPSTPACAPSSQVVFPRTLCYVVTIWNVFSHCFGKLHPSDHATSHYKPSESFFFLNQKQKYPGPKR